jgi:pimeloyl-ACP methyl ester carboxylesterase
MDHLKRNEAMRRAMSRSRMIDYGLTPSQADDVHTEAVMGKPWEEILCRIADHARAAGHYGQAAAAMNFAQMAESFDTVQRVSLYRQGASDFARHVAELPQPPERIRLPYMGGTVFAWDFKAEAQDGALLILGGMSGWANSFLRIANAVTAKGMRCILMDGPGQGDTRIDGGLYLQDGYIGAVSAMLDHMEATGSSSVGIWGNSMGGLFAMISARDEPRFKAACSNGAPTRMFLPEFRMAAEQMAALFGAKTVEEAAMLPSLKEVFDIFHFDGTVCPLPCPGIVCEGGADPLAPPGTQVPFLERNIHVASQVLVWEDGEHAIYNHADDRNEKLTTWFSTQLRG